MTEREHEWWDDKDAVQRQIVGQAGLLCSKLRHGDPHDKTVDYIERLLALLEPDDG